VISSKKKIAAILPLLAAMGVVMLAGCRNAHRSPDSPTIRMIDAVPGSDGVEIIINGKSHLRGPSYREGLRSFDTTPGQYKISIQVERSGEKPVRLPELHLSAANWRRYTYIVYDAGGVVKVKAITDIVDKTKREGVAVARVVNASPDVSRLDIGLNAIVSFSAVKFASESDSIRIAPKVYQVSALESMQGYSPVADNLEARFDEGRDYTIVVFGRKAGGEAKIQIVEGGGK
jgi:hypothetical protein